MPTDQPQQPGFLDSLSSGAQSRNLLPALALGGLIGLLPPLLYGKRSRRGAARAWGGIGANLAFNELERPDRERKTKQDALGRLVSAGIASTTGAPGARPLGDYGGINVYQTPTMAEQFRDIFTPPTPPTGGPGARQTALTETDLSTGQTQTVEAGPPTRPMNPAIQLFGAMPASAENMAAAAKFLHSEQQADVERTRRTESLRQGQQYAAENGLVYLPSVDAEGNSTFRTAPAPRAPRPSRFEEYVSVKEGALGKPLTDDERLAAWNETKSSLGQTLDEAFTKQSFNLEVGRLSRELSKGRETMNGLLLKVPRQYQGYAKNLKTWQALKENPQAMQAIKEKRHGEIEFTLEKYEDLVRERDDFYRSQGVGQSQEVTLPDAQKGEKPAPVQPQALTLEEATRKQAFVRS